MTTLDKAKVLAEFTSAYKAAFGKAPKIEEKPGWYSVDGSKNMRLAELDQLGKSYSKEASAADKTSVKADKPAKKAATKAKTKPTTAAAKPKQPKVTASGSGETPLYIWQQYIGSINQRMPRGCR